MSNILKTSCVVPFTTPSGSITNLPINCAATDSDSWNWKYFWVKTQGLTTTQGFTRSINYETLPSNSRMLIESSGSFQLVTRGMFAYVATDPVLLNIEINSYVVLPFTDYSLIQASIQIYGKLFDPSGNTITTTFQELGNFNSSNNNTSGIIQTMDRTYTATLPATNCPLVYFVWIRGLAYGVPNPYMDQTYFKGDIDLNAISTV